MSNPQKRKGDDFERDIEVHCEAAGFTTSRTRPGFARDHGDVQLALTPAGPQVVIQAKCEARHDLPGYLRAVVKQRDAAGARYGLAVVKRRGVADAGRQYAVLELDWLLALLQEAGYGASDEGSREGLLNRIAELELEVSTLRRELGKVASRAQEQARLRAHAMMPRRTPIPDELRETAEQIAESYGLRQGGADR